MKTQTVPAYAKLNLTLDILGKRPDGYHELRMVMQTVSLCDDVTVTLTDGTGVACRVAGAELPCDERNLAVKAANAFCEALDHHGGIDIALTKRIPSEAGMAGGSADAAAVLRALRDLIAPTLTDERLETIGARVGSDVPFCVLCGTAQVEGRGELLTQIPGVPEFFVVVCKPDFSVSTAELYAKLDEEFIEKRPDHRAMMSNLQKGELLGVGGSLCNVIEPLVLKDHFDLNYIRSMMITYGAYGAQMTGSGSAVFGIYDSFEYASVACMMLKEKYSQVFLTTTV